MRDWIPWAPSILTTGLTFPHAVQASKTSLSDAQNEANEISMQTELLPYVKTVNSYRAFVFSLQIVHTNLLDRNRMRNGPNCSFLKTWRKETYSGTEIALSTIHQFVLWPRLLSGKGNSEFVLISFTSFSSKGNKCLLSIREIALAERTEF